MNRESICLFVCLSFLEERYENWLRLTKGCCLNCRSAGESVRVYVCGCTRVCSGSELNNGRAYAAFSDGRRSIWLSTVRLFFSSHAHISFLSCHLLTRRHHSANSLRHFTPAILLPRLCQVYDIRTEKKRTLDCQGWRVGEGGRRAVTSFEPCSRARKM